MNAAVDFAKPLSDRRQVALRHHVHSVSECFDGNRILLASVGERILFVDE